MKVPKTRQRADKRRTLYDYYRGRCVYCNVEMTEGETTLDHLVTKSAGGRLEVNNLVLACAACNHSRSDRDVIAFMASKRCRNMTDKMRRHVTRKYVAAVGKYTHEKGNEVLA